MMPVVLANPSRRRRRAKTHAKRRHHALHAHRRANPSVKRRRRQFQPHIHHARRRHRRSNPAGMKIASVIRIGVAGGLGIVVARIAGNLYATHLSSYVRGYDSSVTWRAWLDDVMRLVATEAGVLIVERAARSAGIGSPSDRMAFVVGGSAETARYAVGTVLKHLSPTTDRAKYGLDGRSGGAMGCPAFITQDGGLMVRGANGQYQLEGLVDRTALEGLVPRSQFAAAQ